jgi:hypothetical protein|tara:strand:- start:3794 stop:4033 length:240 start_codon:yes stop_codon:yes gene_type:complete
VDDKFFNELINGEPLLCSCVQMGIIESLLRISPISEDEKGKIYKELEFYSEEEAEKIISLLKKDVITIDPKDQWKKMFN